MRFVLFCHSLVSDWNHGNAHFLRGVLRELGARGHGVRVSEPRGGWSRANLVAHLDQIRAQGYAIDDVENEEGIRCIGAPILGNAGLPIAALSISGPTVRMTPERVQELAPALLETGRRISQKFGFVAPQRDGVSVDGQLSESPHTSAKTLAKEVKPRTKVNFVPGVGADEGLLS
jgi:hypothetical protein